MWSRASTDSAPRRVRAVVASPVTGGGARPRFAFRLAGTPAAIGGTLLSVAMLFLAACSSAPSKPTESASTPVTETSGGKAASGAPGAPGAAKGGTAAATGGAAPGGAAAGANGAAAVPITARGKADFDRAVGMMKAGNTTEAELEFKQVALQFPQLSSPYVNLGILYRKAGRLDQSEEALKTAVEHNDGSAVAWTELGATQRLRGEFPSAAASYEKAIAADPNFAPAYRNLGVVSDLYLGDPERALTAFEHYKELTGEEKPVSGWIAELRQRTGKPPLKRAAPAPAAGASDNGSAPGAAGDGAAGPTDGAAPGAAGGPAPTGSDATSGPAAPAGASPAPNGPSSGKPAEPAAGAAPPKSGD